MEENKDNQGFFVKIDRFKYTGPFENLNGARGEARKIGPDLEIYHGILEDNVEDSKLYLVPKSRK